MDLMPDKVNYVIEIALFMSDSNENQFKDQGSYDFKDENVNNFGQMFPQ